MKKKKYFLCMLVVLCSATTGSTQSWSINGNNNITVSNFLGTTNARDIIFRTNNLERGRIIQNGSWRFGTGTNYVQIDNAGVISLAGNAVYQVGGNKYVFQFAGNTNYGLYFNQTSTRYEFRNGSAVPVFYVNANNGNGVFNGTLKIGAYTLPSIDGINGQVLKTNGAGLLNWSNDNNNIYTEGNGINITGNVITNTAPDQEVLLNAGIGINVSGTYPNFTISNNVLPGWSLTGNTGTIAGTNFIGTIDDQPLQFRVNNQLSGLININELNTGFGYQSLLSNSSGINLTAYGYQALNNNTSGSYNTAFGSSALQSNTTATGNTAMGWRSLQTNSTGSGNTAYGSGSLRANNSGEFNTAIGISSLEINSNGKWNTAVGHGTISNNSSGEGNTALGDLALSNNSSGNFNNAIGFRANVKTNNLYNATAIGSWAYVEQDSSLVLGSIRGVNEAPSNVNVGIGTTKPSERLEIVGKTKTINFQMTNGAEPGYIMRSDIAGNASWAASTDLAITENDPKIGSLISAKIPKWNGTKLVDGNITDSGTNVGIGTVNPMAKLDVAGGDALINGITIGRGAGAIHTNTAIGYETFIANTTGDFNTAIGLHSLISNTTGHHNTGTGSGSINFNTEGAENTGNGWNTLFNNTFGNYNTALGSSALITNTTGSINTGLGYNAQVGAPDLNNATAIGANAFVGISNSMVLGSVGGVNGATDTIKVGIGTTAPNERLEVFGKTKTTNFQMTDGATSGYVLSSDAAGNASWVNSTTLPITETDPKIGSLTSNKISKWNGTSLIDGNIFDDGINIGIGTITPTKKLEVTGGDALINNITVGIGGGNISSNTAFGSSSLSINSTGNSNTAVGKQSLSGNTTGSYNTGIGYQALYGFVGQAGDYNTAIGAQSLWSNMDGLSNTAIGANSLKTNTTGDFNSANGFSSLYSNTTGNSNVAIGTNALYSNTTSSKLVAIGDSALYNNTGSFNTGVGSKVLYSNTTGSYNTAEGYQALYSNTTGVGNIANGVQALYSNTIGGNNIANGNAVLYSNTTGSYNTASGYVSLFHNSSGSNNTAYGNNALYYNVNGNCNTALGYSADVSTDALFNATALGFGATVNANNKVRIGNASVTSIEGQVGWTTPSDARIKDNIKENVPGLIFIKALKPVTFHFNCEKQINIMGIKDTIKWQGKYDIEKMTFSGFNAQDVEAAAKKINYDFSGVDKSGKIMGLRYAEFVVPLVKAVQELSSMNDEKDAKIDDLQKQINDLKALVLSIQQCNPCSATTTVATPSYKIIISDAASLEQNIPNPFSNTTVINYTLPQKFTTAQMIITDKIGKVLKQVTIAGSGKGMLTVDASTLSSGAYQYSLIIDGKLIATRQMVLTK